jgi:hypothetical protein
MPAKENNKAEQKENGKVELPDTPKPTCNIIMPISAFEDYSEGHWSDMHAILRDVIESAGFTGDLVSNADETNIIHKTIVQNTYNSDVVICDVSGKNANVMFELGLRLGFDKAIIIIKDEITTFSFDTSPIEHLIYPRDLHFHKIVDFKEKLRNKIAATYKKSKSDPNFSPYLKSFGEFKIAHLESKEVSSDEFIIESLKELKNGINSLRVANNLGGRVVSARPTQRHNFDNDERVYYHVEIKFQPEDKVPMDKIKSFLERSFKDNLGGIGKAVLPDYESIKLIFRSPITEKELEDALTSMYELEIYLGSYQVLWS